MQDPLQLGIKRRVHRHSDAHAAMADAEFASLRSAALQRSGYRCVRCGLESAATAQKPTALQVHHEDDDHTNNAPENLSSYCTLDHAIHHIGCDAPSPGGHEGWASRMRVVYAPELATEDFNLLQRAAGAALAEPSLAEVAKEIVGLLGVLASPVRELYGSHHAKDFAAAMAAMDDDQYAKRAVSDLRVVFHPDILRDAGARMVSDQPLMAPRNWSAVSGGTGGR